MIARIKYNQDVDLYTNDFPEKYPDLVVGWEILEITDEEADFIRSCKLPKRIDGVFIEAFIEVVIVPEEISRMKFEMQVLLTTGIEWDGIIAYIVAIEMSQLYKKLLLIRLKRCVTLKREDNDLNTIAAMMGITQEQLDEIFINGNLID